MSRQVDPNSSAARIRAALLARNRSASDLARACGFSRQNMQRFLDGEITRSKHFPAIATALDVALAWLLTGDPATAPSWWAVFVKTYGGSPPTEPAGDGEPSLMPASDLPSHWRLTPSPHSILLGSAPAESHLILDAQRIPAEGDLILIPSKDGPRLRRLGPTIAGRMVLVAVDGSFAIETCSAPLSTAVTVVVGVLFPRKKH